MILRFAITILAIGSLSGCANKVESEPPDADYSSDLQEEPASENLGESYLTDQEAGSTEDQGYSYSSDNQYGSGYISNNSAEAEEDDSQVESNYSGHSRDNNCYGSDNYYTCDDPRTGNTYQVSKYGNTTEVQGSNSSTGSSWSQTTNTYGSTSYTTGTDKDGNSWEQTTNHYGNDSYSYTGTDSDGNSFSGSCSYGTCTNY